MVHRQLWTTGVLPFVMLAFFVAQMPETALRIYQTTERQVSRMNVKNEGRSPWQKEMDFGELAASETAQAQQVL